jgi:hypothetical protein
LGAAVFAIARHDSLRCSAKVAALKTVFSDPGTSARPASSRRSPAAFVSTPGNVSGAFRPSALRTPANWGRSRASGFVGPTFGTGAIAGWRSPHTPARGE